MQKNSFVREQLVELQRNFADNPPNKKGSVIDGRDITSVIVPNADVKFGVDANLHKRAKGDKFNSTLTDKYYSQVFDEMKLRDYNDKNRKISPLIKTEDSFYIDTTNISESKVIEIAIKEIKKLILFSHCITH